MSALAPSPGEPGPAGSPLPAILAAAQAGVPHQIQVQPGVNPQSPSQPAGDAAFKSALAKAIDDLHALAGLADDPQDRQNVIKCLQALNGIQASEQKERDSAMGGKLSPRLMRSAYSSG